MQKLPCICVISVAFSGFAPGIAESQGMELKTVSSKGHGRTEKKMCKCENVQMSK